MAYIGAQPNKTLTKTTSQSFNGTGSATAFTLNRAVNTGEELEVFVDNVQQEPGSGKSYTATGTTLTFDEAPPSGTGNVYVIYRGQAEVTTRLEAPDLSITTAKIADDAVTTAKIADDAVTKAKIGATELDLATIKDSSGTNTAMTIDSTGRILTPARPAFSVVQYEPTTSAAQNGHYNFNTVLTNVGSYYSTSNNRFEVPVTGFYNFSFAGLGCNSAASVIPAASQGWVKIEKSTDSGSNWSTLASGYAYAGNSNHYPNLSCSVSVTLNSGDYVRIYVENQYVYSHTQSTGYNPTFSGFFVG